MAVKATDSKAKITKTTAKTEPAKAIETKKDTTKAIETRAAVLKEAEPEKPAAVKKTAAKKATAKKAAEPVKRAEIKTTVYLQFAGKEYTEKEILKKIKEVWTKTLKNKVGDIKSVEIYLKPEEAAAYFVVNGETTGRVEL